MRDLAERFKARIPLLEQLAANLDREVRDVLDGVPHIDRVAFRAKGLTSFLTKARDPDKGYQHPLVEIEDQVAGRVLVFFLQDIDIVVAALKQRFNEVESKRKEPRNEGEFGYESHHLVCMIPPQFEPKSWSSQEDLPRTFELQVRTLFMHAWAEPQHDLGYKPDAVVPRDIKREWAWAAASAWGADQAIQRVLRWHMASQTKPS